jgi:hypothetical protein
MIVFQEVSLATVQQHELDTNSNVRLGGYHMDRFCPTAEFCCHRVQLQHSDGDRLFLLGISAFISQTQRDSCRLRDLLPTAASIPNVASFVRDGVDLRSQPCLELVLVGAQLQLGHLVAIDGNHRMMAHYLNHASVEGVPAFVCVHKNITQWSYIPTLAR